MAGRTCQGGGGLSAVAAAYARLVTSGELRADRCQAAVVARLDALADALELPPPGLFGRLLGRAAPVPKGVYLWGGVGRGKSMLMDLFHANCAAQPSTRIHFAEFMAETHARLHHAREADPGDPIPAVAAGWRAQARLLCFDELQVTNVADAMILSRLFAALLDAGACVVATSNRPPDDLYKDGLNRPLFEPFIATLDSRLDVVALDGPTDYRLDRLGDMATYYVPNGPAATAALSEAFFRLTDYPVEDRAMVPTEALPVPGGRTLHVPKSLKGVAVFSFKRLCGAALWSPDYIAVARRYHTVILVGVPVLGPEQRNEAARFVALVDALYEHKVKLLMAADAEPDALYPAGDGSFEFQRTASRLHEMRSAAYLALGHNA